MKKISLIAVLLGFVWQGWGQDEATKAEFKETFKKLEKTFEKYKKLYDEENKKLEELKNKVGINSDQTFMTELSNQIEKTKKYNDSLVDQLELFRNYKNVYIHKGFEEDDINSLYKYAGEQFSKSPQKKTETQVYSYFGQDEVINHSILNKKSVEADILKKVLLDKGEESYIGDITIPQHNQRIKLYYLPPFKKKKDSMRKDLKYEKREFESGLYYTDTMFNFQKLDVEIRDGYFYDIRVFLVDEEDNVHVFSNKVGISLLFYSQYGGRKKFLNYTYSIRKNTPEIEYTDPLLMNLCVKVTDVLRYTYKAGNHYIPHDLVLELPVEDKGYKTNLISNTTYQIKQETHLEKILELRTYTDFLALFGESNNGLAQIEGKAKLYLFPYPFHFIREIGQIEYFPSFSSYANYSRFDNTNKYVDLTEIQSDINYFVPNNELDLVEKRFLTMGIDVEALKWQHKNAPIKVSLYGTFNYNISSVNLGTPETPDIRELKAFNKGYGAHLSAKRFNNFGFDYKMEFSWYDYASFNSYNDVHLPPDIAVWKNEAELFYHTNGNPNQAIFVRLITYKNRADNSNEAFYQFQFGYKFALGARKVKALD